MLPEQQRILGYFIEEAVEHLQTIERGLLNLQSTIDDAEFANEIFRAAHSVKGGAAMLGLGSIAAISHRLEDYFKLLKDRPIVVNNQVESQFLVIFDALQDQVGELKRTADPSSLDEASVIATLDPVFQDLKAQLDRLASDTEHNAPTAPKQTANHQRIANPRAIPLDAQRTGQSPPMTLPLSQPSEEQSALQLIFHTDVLARLREILRLFQSTETPETRQKICDICRVLAKVGDQFELPQWRHLLDVTHEAISQPKNRFSDLATVAIKELKQAQELVLADREPDITISDALRALLPLNAEHHPLGNGVEDEFDDLFDPHELGDSESEAIIEADDLFADLDMPPSIHPESTSSRPLFDDLGLTHSSEKPKRHGPEVGSAELSSLADLFEAGMDGLESWDSLDRGDDSARNPLGDPDAEEIDSDFADLFASDDDLDDHPMPDEVDDLDSLFDDIAEATEDEVSEEFATNTALQSPPIDPRRTESPTNPQLEPRSSGRGADSLAIDEFDGLFDLLEDDPETVQVSEPEAEVMATANNIEPIGLDLDDIDLDDFGGDFNFDDEGEDDEQDSELDRASGEAASAEFDGDLDLNLEPTHDDDEWSPIDAIEFDFDLEDGDRESARAATSLEGLSSEEVNDSDHFDDFDDLFGSLEPSDSEDSEDAMGLTIDAGESAATLELPQTDLGNLFEDDFGLFDLNVGEAETFEPPQTKPPLPDDDDLSLDDLFDDFNDFEAAEKPTDRLVNPTPSTAQSTAQSSDRQPTHPPREQDTEDDDSGGDLGDDFGDLFAGLDLPDTEENLEGNLDKTFDETFDATFDEFSGLDDLDLSEALADVSIDFAQMMGLTLEDEAAVADDDSDPRLFPHLGIWLDLPATYAGADVFEALEAYLDQPLRPAISGLATVSSASTTDDFADLEDLLELDGPTAPGTPKTAADRATATSAPRGNARRQRGRGSAFEQTMRVPIKQLDDLSNLVGELVVNRNSLEDDQERLRQFLDNLLHQVSQLSEVGQRMQDLYERTLLEMALLASRKNRTIAAQGGNVPNASHDGDEDFDALEMDKFSLFHLQAQEIIELVVRVRESSSDIEFLVDENDQVTRQLRQVTTQLQEGLNRSRMVAFSSAADRLPRGVRDNAIKFGKQVNLQIEGRDMLIDRMILEHLYDPLTHLVNNAIAHGIETPDERLAKGKPTQGTITVSSFNQGNQTIIAISDDGAGIDKERVVEKAIQKGVLSKEQAKTLTDPEIYDLLFLPGLSTRDRADDLAGRGVGMDVVKTKLNEIRGVIITDSTRDQGTNFTIRLPLTLSISKALCCISDHAPIAFPMDGVSEVLDNLPRERIIRESDDTAYVQWREQKVPYQPLSSLFNYSRLSIRPQMYGSTSDDDTVSVVILRSAGSQLAISVDSIVGEQEIVIKQLEGPIPKPVGITGATVMGDGHIVPIADVLELIDLSLGRVRRDASSLWDETEEATVVQVEKAEPMVLIIDDSITVRELLSMTFKKSGYRVEQARDGQEAWEKMRSGMPCELVFCDMEMPRMNGMELLEKMSTDPRLSALPIAMLTSRTAEKMKRRAAELGAKGYFTKPYLEEVLLDAAQRMLTGENLMAASGATAEPASTP